MVNASWMKGTVILTITSFFIKILSMVYKIPYQNIVGDEGLYVFQQVYPLLGVYMILSTVVLPTVISDLLLTYQYSEDIKLYIKRSLWIFSIFIFGILFLGSNQIAHLMGDVQLATSIRIIGLFFLPMPTLVYLRGVAQTRANTIYRVGISNTIEQIVRVAAIVLVLVQFNRSDIYEIAYSSYLLGILGPLLALIYLSLLKRDDSPQIFLKMKSHPQLFKKILFLFLCAGILIIFQLIDSFFIFNSLVRGGTSALEAMQLKGIYDRGLPIIQSATFFVSAIASSTVPQMSKAKDEKEQNNIFNSALFFIILCSIPAAVGLFTVVEQLNIALFTDSSGTLALKILSAQVLFYPFTYLITAVSQQENRYSQLLVSVLAGIFFKLILTAPLTQSFGINGAALSSVVAIGVMCLINIIQFRKRIFKQSIFNFIKTLISAGCMWVCIDYLSPTLINYFASENVRLFNIMSLLVQVFVGIVTYMIFMMLFILTSKSPSSGVKGRKRKKRRNNSRRLKK